MPKGYVRGGFSIGIHEVSLTDEIIDELKMRPALERFGRELLKQYKNHKMRDGGDIVLGINLCTIDFYFQFAKQENKKKNG